ncbi:uncharacterized protein FTJAE_11205 [Fusarium tjaetaba]|uniref:Uncharacterized protein n=1 Tax=Fusarium tjaetaba TaxID=1567544 RepID=A0A8H5VEH1_9HYPO|nr:uncharacterized protein FTJAE_11205 [Fusarium tjaetaba]KAF5621572.1 hypothetical protein FTJAE_11205 [Fusarium tjaetaba]
MPEYSQTYLNDLGREWLVRWSNAVWSVRSHARLAICLMANIASTEVIDRLATSELYRKRTNVIFGVMWNTDDGHSWRPSVTSGDMVDLETAWAADRLWRFDLFAIDNNIYIAEGQYASGCLRQAGFDVHGVMDRIFELVEEEEEEERLRRINNIRQARILARELVPCGSHLQLYQPDMLENSRIHGLP